jgi:hypothetical protein
MLMYQIYRKMQGVVWVLIVASTLCIVTSAATAATLLAPHAATMQKKSTGIPKKKPAAKPRAPTIIPVRTAYTPTPSLSTRGDTFNPKPATPPPTNVASPRVVAGTYIRYTPELDASQLAERVQAATVNIVCTVTAHGITRSSLGSGVVISPDGVILTNAHVGIYSLFPEKGAAHCVARGGSPAAYLYDLEPIYISKTWVTEYAPKLFIDNLSGTGAGDYMLLKRKIYADPKVIRLAPLPFLPLDTTLGSIDRGNIVLGAGYPAEFLASESLSSDLYYAASFIVVGEGFTFVTDTADTFSLGGSILARAGISGGPAVDKWGKVVGIMSTATRAKTTAERTLRTISLDYINRDMLASIGMPLADIISPTQIGLEQSATARTYAQQILSGLYPM